MTAVVSSQSSYMMRKEDIRPQWYVVDADGQVVGRLAARLAMVLMGKHRPTWTPHVECGDFVIVTNAEKIRFSGKPLAHKTHPHFTDKMLQKTYDTYSGYPGGRKVMTAAEVWARHPERLLQLAVRRMLPKNKIGHRILKRLKLYVGPEHPHQAQQPQELPEHLRA
jgi:large subunit ribosomal protein L13